MINYYFCKNNQKICAYTLLVSLLSIGGLSIVAITAIIQTSLIKKKLMFKDVEKKEYTWQILLIYTD